MSKAPSPDQQRAFEIWCQSGRTMKPAAIATELGISARLISKWKSINKWETLPDPPPKRRGPPKGSKNAKGNRGGKGGPIGNDKAVKHGLFRKILPDDDEAREIFDATEEMSPLDMLWYQIRIAWTNIMRSQKIQYVKDKDDITKEIKKFKSFQTGEMEEETREYEIQFAWDKQAVALTSQSAAMTALARLFKQYEEMLRTLPPDEVKDEQRQRMELLKAQVEKTKNEAKLAGKGQNKEPLHIEIDYGPEDDES